ncbi:hypothetical protein BLNAU_10650 [Blattamonas nauphoetae]|uniref:Uncharacterized protein n=1 Tax=Blattamonas nauphoetae TaxID=2049346 RepID=A0ABQ9XRX6_9EUKA|nr:hypothetical protein BLNAU_10650 [Blattamonas nauphoetae]
MLFDPSSEGTKNGAGTSSLDSPVASSTLPFWFSTDDNSDSDHLPRHIHQRARTGHIATKLRIRECRLSNFQNERPLFCKRIEDETICVDCVRWIGGEFDRSESGGWVELECVWPSRRQLFRLFSF